MLVTENRLDEWVRGNAGDVQGVIVNSCGVSMRHHVPGHESVVSY